MVHVVIMINPLRKHVLCRCWDTIWILAHQFAHVYIRWLCILQIHGERIHVISVSESEWTTGYLNKHIETIFWSSHHNGHSKYMYIYVLHLFNLPANTCGGIAILNSGIAVYLVMACWGQHAVCRLQMHHFCLSSLQRLPFRALGHFITENAK